MSKLSGLYAITDEVLTPDTTVVEQVQAVLESGIKIIQYRNKKDDDAVIEDVCIALQALCRQHEALFFIDDRPELAQKIGADGLHIGKDDMSLKEARAIFTQGIIGVSCYGSIRLAKEAEQEGADYVAFGSFFKSPTKPKSGIVSMNVIEKAKAAVSIPVCVIGGIDSNNIHEVAQRNPDMISLVSAIFQGDIKANITQIKKGIIYETTVSN